MPAYSLKPKTEKPILTKETFARILADTGINITRISREAGLTRQYVSNFKNSGAGLKPDDLRKLRAALEKYVDFNDDGSGEEFDTDPESGAAPAVPTGKAYHGAIPFPAPAFHCPVSADIEPGHVKAISARLEAVTRRIAELLPKPLAYESGVLIGGTDPTDASRAEHAALVGLLAEEAILRRRLEGRDIAPPLTPQLAEEGTLLNTHAELLARDYPHPAIPNGMIPAAEGGEEEGEDQDGGRDKTPGQPAAKPKPNESIWDQLYGGK